MSGLANFHSKMSDFYTKELSPELININVRINYGLANGFSASLIESILVASAIWLCGENKWRIGLA
jgi:hypothetical protein